MTAASDPYQPLNLLKVSGNLPVIPQILVQLIDLCNREEIDLQAVAGLVRKDAALAAKVLQLCNSAFIGARSPFTDVSQAVIYLGADTIRNLAISVSVQQAFRRVESKGRLFNLDRFWYHSYENAILAQRIAGVSGYTNPSEAYLAGLVHDLGKLVMWMAFPGKYAPLLFRDIRCQGSRLAFLEQENLQINHCDAGAWLLRQWGLPSLMADAVHYHHHPVDEVAQALALTRIVYLADLLSHSEDPEQECNEVAGKLFRLAPGKVNELLEGVDDQIHEVARSLGIRIHRMVRSNLEPAKDESSEVDDQATLELIGRVRDMGQLCGHMRNLLRATDSEQILTTLEQSLLILFHLEPALVLLLTDNGARMQAFSSRNNKLADQAATLNFSPARHENSLPVQCLSHDQLLHSFMARPDRDPTMLDTQLINLLGNEGMILIPLRAVSRPIGVLVVGVRKDAHLNILTQSDPLLLLASQAGMALHILRRHEQEQRCMADFNLKGAVSLARRIAHEIHNPVTILQSHLKSLGHRLEDSEELRIMVEECARISAITRQLLDIAGSGQVMPDQEIDLNYFLDSFIRLYQDGLNLEKKVPPSFEPASEPIIITTDENALGQILTDLITNALNAGSGTILVTVTLDREGEQEQACIRISGNGSALDLDSGRSGPGLASVNSLVHQLGGTINCFEENDKTVCSLCLPVTPE